MPSKQIKVMIIDDSALIRNLITKLLSTNDSIEVVGTALNGKFGLKKLNTLEPDIIILDLEMPEMNGIEFLKEREKLGIKTPVIILSAHAKKGAEITLQALSLGASDFILKPSDTDNNLESMKDRLISMIMALAKPDSFSTIDIKTKEPALFENDFKFAVQPLININSYLRPINTIPDISIVVIGISTGGPNALRQILPLLPKEFPVQIAIVQHMPAGFTYEFAKNLNNICNLEVKEAEDNDILSPGRIFIAPGNRHIIFEKKQLATVIRLDDSSPVNGHKPSADVLFESTANIFGHNALACIMTGMGKDGADKIGNILNKGGITIAQDQESSVVFGMPKVAILNKNIQIVKPLNKIAESFIDIVMYKTIKI
jgi:two-component system chemotaxis response regulator CheB